MYSTYTFHVRALKCSRTDAEGIQIVHHTQIENVKKCGWLNYGDPERVHL